MSEELKPCPFCGQSTSIHKTHKGGFIAHCNACPASSLVLKTLELSLAAWNRRPSPPPSSEMREALEEVAKRGCGCSARGDKDWHGKGCYFPAVVDALRSSSPSAEIAGAEKEVIEAAKNVFGVKRPNYHDCLDDGLPECEWCLLEKALSRLAALGKEKL